MTEGIIRTTRGKETCESCGAIVDQRKPFTQTQTGYRHNVCDLCRPIAPKRLSKIQRQEMLNIISGVNDETIRGKTDLPDDMPEWFLDWPLWSAGENMPGYLPDSPYCLFLTERAARGYCRELERESGGHDYVSDFMPVSLREILS